jgi:hypothetical protein
MRRLSGFSVFFLLLNCLSLFGQENDSLFYSYRFEKNIWILREKGNEIYLEKENELSSADDFKIHISKAHFDKEKSKLSISGNIIGTFTGWRNEAVIIVSCRKDTIQEIRAMNDYTGLIKINTQMIRFANYKIFKFNKYSKFECSLDIKPDYDLLVIGLDSHYAILFDLIKIEKNYSH